MVLQSIDNDSRNGNSRNEAVYENTIWIERTGQGMCALTQDVMKGHWHERLGLVASAWQVLLWRVIIKVTFPRKYFAPSLRLHEAPIFLKYIFHAGSMPSDQFFSFGRLIRRFGSYYRHSKASKAMRTALPLSTYHLPRILILLYLKSYPIYSSFSPQLHPPCYS